MSQHRPSLPGPAAMRVSPQDLTHLGDVLDMLSLLNDQFAAADDLAVHVARMPSLAARVTRTYHAMFLGRGLPPLRAQLGGIGNRKLEALLLEFLEDLTILHADLAGD